MLSLPITTEAKRCCTCKQVRPYEEFYFSTTEKDGLYGRCKDCCAFFAVKAKAWQAKYYRLNIEKFKAQDAQHYLRNKEQILTRAKDNYRKNEEQRKRYAKERRKLDLVRRRRNETERRRKLNDVGYRIQCGLRSRIWECVVGRRAQRAGKKAATIIELVGCTRDELLVHLQKQFRSGMEWNNYGL